MPAIASRVSVGGLRIMGCYDDKRPGAIMLTQEISQGHGPVRVGSEHLDQFRLDGPGEHFPVLVRFRELLLAIADASPLGMIFHDEAAGGWPDLGSDPADFFGIEDREMPCGGVLVAGMIDAEEP